MPVSIAGSGASMKNDLEGEGAGEGVDGLETALLHQVGDQSVGLGGDGALESAQRAGRQVLGEGGA